MTEESKPVEVSRRIEAPVALIFEILANPQRHMDFDGSDMLRGAVLRLTVAMTACSLPTDAAQVVDTGVLLLRRNEGEIARISVHRNCRRRGIATQLLAELLHLASECEINCIVVETNAK